MDFQFDHIGWVTDNLGLFEEFWCRGMGFELIHTSIDTDMGPVLFDHNGRAVIRLYAHPQLSIRIEIHQFDHNMSYRDHASFLRKGLNHVCIHTGGPGSRLEFIKELQAKIRTSFEVKIFDNPKGWQNIFIKDLENNWIELREKLDG